METEDRILSCVNIWWQFIHQLIQRHRVMRQAQHIRRKHFYQKEESVVLVFLSDAPLKYA